MNITIFSLALSNTYSQSPNFVGNNMSIGKSYILSSFSTFLYNPKFFKINHCYFNKMIKVIIKNDDISAIFMSKNISLFEEDMMKPIEISNESLDTPFERDSNPALVIHDCIFINIFSTSFSYAVHIYRRMPFYMTSCNFVNCSILDAVCKIETQATTITHICMTNCYSINSFNYFHFDFDSNSFLKLIFSTFTSESQTINDYSQSQGGFNFQCGNILVKCSNISQINNVNYPIVITTPSYFLFSMNTVYGSYQCDYTFSSAVGFYMYKYVYSL